MVTAFVALVGGTIGVAATTNAESAFVGSDSGTTTLEKSKTHTGSYYVAGKDIVIDGTITGDLYCAGQTVQINGTVDGDVLCAAQDIKISGNIGQDVRAAGQFVSVSGKVGGTLTSFAQKVEISKGATVAGDVNGAAQDFVIDGVVSRDLAIGSDTISIAGVVDGDARIAASNYFLMSTPAVKGNLEYDGETKQNIPASAVAGQIKFNKVDSPESRSDGNAGAEIAQFYIFVVLAFVVIRFST